MVEVSPSPRQHRQHEQVQCGAGEESTENHDGHRAFDFATGTFAAERQRQQAERGDERGHEDGHESLARAAQRRCEIPRAAFHADQLVVVRDEHDAVARREAEEGDEPDERTDGEQAAASKDRERAANECEGHVRQHEQEVASVAEYYGQQEDDANAGQRGVDEQFAAGAALGFGGAAVARIDAGRERDFSDDAALEFGQEARAVAAGGVAGDLLAALCAFVDDDAAAVGEENVGDFAQ